ncbi:MAG: hypothetical protein ACKPKO_32250, partial [Candidatus Fonsibacter sp.]
MANGFPSMDIAEFRRCPDGSCRSRFWPKVAAFRYWRLWGSRSAAHTWLLLHCAHDIGIMESPDDQLDNDMHTLRALVSERAVIGGR